MREGRAGELFGIINLLRMSAETVETAGILRDDGGPPAYRIQEVQDLGGGALYSLPSYFCVLLLKQ